MKKLAILTSHPIQHQAPLFREVVKTGQVDLTVLFNWEGSSRKPVFDKEFGREVKWDTPVLEGYAHKFLQNYSPKPSSEFWGQINPGIIGEVWDGGYDAVLIFGWNSFTNWLAFLTAFFTGTPVFLRGENPLNQEIFKAPWKRRIKRLVLTPLFSLIKAFLYIGQENKKFYEHFGVPASKLFFCPYADENERYIADAVRYAPQKEEIKKEFGIPAGKAVILFAGKFIEKKRPLDLLRAYEQLPDDAELIFVGDGPLRPQMEKYINERKLRGVHLAGFQNLTELPRWYAASDILVLPSEGGETWGLVVNIAMCFRLPVIVSDAVGCGPDLVRSGENGYIFKTGEIDKLAHYLQELVLDEGKRRVFGSRSFELVQGYTFRKDAEGILAALSSIR